MIWTLGAAVGMLTRPTKHRLVDAATGEVQWVTADPLLLQLAQAIGNSGGSTAFKSSGGTPLPISAQALDLYRDIERTTAERWWALHGLHHGQGRSTLGGRLRAWAMAAQASQDHLAEAEKIMCGWVDAITALLQPVRRREIIGGCPECGVRTVQRLDVSGEQVKVHALALLYNEAGQPDQAVCSACGACWPRASIWELAEAVNGGGMAWHKQ